MIELYSVAPGQDDAFLAAFAQDRPPGHTLYKALRDDARHRFASIDGPPRDGALLIIAGDHDLTPFKGRQGFLTTERHGDLALIHWSSPLMYARAVAALSVPLARAERSLYARV